MSSNMKDIVELVSGRMHHNGQMPSIRPLINVQRYVEP